MEVDLRSRLQTRLLKLKTMTNPLLRPCQGPLLGTPFVGFENLVREVLGTPRRFFSSNIGSNLQCEHEEDRLEHRRKAFLRLRFVRSKACPALAPLTIGMR